mmetsp:Transcript_71292/g.189125  ORF Transcript_71292/g.189125 Transcript_71292/m.189125 type:complete len:207 (+) Transcript_71292:246-866(+)
MPGRPVPAQERGGGLPRGGRPAPGLWRALCGRERACGMRASCGRLGAVPFKSAREEIVRRAARIRRLQTPRAAVTLGDSSALLSRCLQGLRREGDPRCCPRGLVSLVRGACVVGSSIHVVGLGALCPCPMAFTGTVPDACAVGPSQEVLCPKHGLHGPRSCWAVPTVLPPKGSGVALCPQLIRPRGCSAPCARVHFGAFRGTEFFL